MCVCAKSKEYVAGPHVNTTFSHFWKKTLRPDPIYSYSNIIYIYTYGPLKKMYLFCLPGKPDNRRCRKFATGITPNHEVTSHNGRSNKRQNQNCLLCFLLELCLKIVPPDKHVHFFVGPYTIFTQSRLGSSENQAFGCPATLTPMLHR